MLSDNCIYSYPISCTESMPTTKTNKSSADILSFKMLTHTVSELYPVMDSGVANEVEVEYVEEVGEGKKIMVEEENEEKMDSGDGKGTVGVDDGGDPLGAGAEEEEDRVVTESEDEEEPERGMPYSLN